MLGGARLRYQVFLTVKSMERFFTKRGRGYAALRLAPLPDGEVIDRCCIPEPLSNRLRMLLT